MPKRILALALALMCLTGCSSMVDTLSDTLNSLFNSGGEEAEPKPLTDFKVEVELEERWSDTIGVGQGKTYNTLRPAVYGNEIFAADVEGWVVALDRFTGQEKWSRDLKEPLSGGLGVGYGILLVGTLKGDLLALDVSDGSEEWRVSLNSEVLAPPAVNSDVVLVQTQDDTLIALDVDNGSKRWSYESAPAVLTLRGTSSPILSNGLAIAGLSTGKVVALDAQRGIPIWEQRVAIPQGRSELERVVDIDGNLLLSERTLYVVTYQGKVAALDLQSGQVLWQKDASSYVGLAKGYGSVYVVLDNGHIQSIDERSTTVLWSNTALERRQVSAPVTFSSYLAVGDLEGYLHLLSQVDGRFVGRVEINSSGWQFGPISGVRVPAIVEGDWIYCFGNNGDLVALTLQKSE